MDDIAPDRATEVAMARCPAGVLRAALLALLFLSSPPSLAGTTAPERKAAADSLYRHALDELGRGTVEARQSALKDLDRASHLDPGRGDVWLRLGSTCTESGQLARGRKCLERATRLSARDAEAFLALGAAWRWDWLSTLEGASFGAALRAYARAAELAPDRAEAWLGLATLQLARGTEESSMAAALGAYRAAPGSADALLAVACAAYRSGEMELSDSLFKVALTRLPTETRRRFEDPLPVEEAAPAEAADGSALPPPAADSAYWRGNDPDLTTAVNEAKLDFMARVAHALLLFRDRDRVRWDVRAEMVVRYGLPAEIEFDPLDLARYEANPLDFQRDFTYSRYGRVSPYVPSALAYPFNVQVWQYPELGMRVELWDRSLQQSYQLPYSTDSDLDPRPDPAALAGRTDLVALGDGRGVFRAIPPRAHPLAARAQLARFPIAGGTRLAAYLAAPGSDADTLRGSWAVATAQGIVVAQGARELAPSVCDPARLRIADFAASLPPGDYRMDLAVSDTHGGRGLAHLNTRVELPSERLALSDLVILCGDASAFEGARELRLDPSLDGRLSGARSLSVYFEIANLATDAGGTARYAYTYTVRPAGKSAPGAAGGGRRPEPLLSASREETNAGALRRQFVTVPVPSLPAGAYDLDVEVRDLAAGTSAARSVRFAK
jgi:tetratricopeptide (TPR) repeat protein